MKLYVILPLWALFTNTHQKSPSDNCLCELINSEKPFPYDKLEIAQDRASRCTNNITPQKSSTLDGLMLGLDRRLLQLEKDVAILENEDDGKLFGALSLQIIENEIVEIQQLIDRLNSSTKENKNLSENMAQQLEDVKKEMEELEAFDTMQVVKRQQANQRLKRDLDRCKNNGVHPTTQPTQPTGTCPLGKFLNITGPRVQTAGEYAGSFKFGGWGRDPKPEPGKESWYWRVMLTSSNRYAHYVRLYSSLSSLIVGISVPGNVQIHPSNPTTNTIQGPNVVLYAGALYYNCYNKDSVCRFNLTSKTVTTLDLPKGTRYNSKGDFCNLEECYLYTDLDLATDESGVWVVYSTTQDFGNLLVSKVEESEPPKLGKTWRTSVYKRSVTNTFMACGVLYATRFVNKNIEEIFYSFDTTTGEENFNVGIFINKVAANLLFLNYSPVDQMLHAYCDAQMASYKVLFQSGGNSFTY
ncbi:PREDICTED: olfactomedin-4-like [Cyprinodon variegatus]|uniref:Olfactomedin-4-like n=1 Tax=Cyprinodon variegatus TaxID=28743 RepID=A0A3Q2CNJ2_CYPVA|nr:PREDICTED: olfactomedin-4-like [Cyprinodon variegatus]